MGEFRIFTIILLFFTTTINAQLTDFNLDVTKTDEICLGNGSLTFNVSGTTEGASLIYKVYLLPDLINPFAITEDNYVGGLSAGTYRVEAIQALGEFSNSQVVEVTINEDVSPFEIEVSSNVESCATGGDIIVEATLGSAVEYEIISGPELRPLQSSNIFIGLPSGTYNIRAFNACGIGKVKTYTLTVLTSTLNISNPFYPNAIETICDSITVNNTITASAGEIRYPLAVEYSMNAMTIGGDSVVINQYFEDGPEDELEVSAVLPRFMQDSYTYELKVTDYCNTEYEKTDNIVDPNIFLRLFEKDALCADKYFRLAIKKFVGSYTLEFLSYPEGFNPEDYHATPYGPFTTNNVTYGSETNPVPFGEYIVRVTDECNRVAIASVLLEFEHPTPTVSARNNGCFSEFGRIRISLENSSLVEATIIDAPGNYQGALPQNVNENILSNGMLNLPDMPVGEYTISFKDDCGFDYQVTVEVPPFVEREFNSATLPACTEGYGSVRLRSGNGSLTEVLTIAAPVLYSEQYPENVSYNIDGGNFYMSDLPAGEYIFRATDECGIVHDMPVTVEGYQAPQGNLFEFMPKCGSFAVKVTDDSNATEGAGYWLQKYDYENDNWVHPQTNVVYNEGDMPDSTTGIALTNNTVKNNLNYSGLFRIIKRYQTFSSGSAENTVCGDELGQMEYYDEFNINATYSLACMGSPNDVYVEVTGNPVSYKIIEKDGANFIVDNGTDNIFRDLEPAEYVISIEDNCGNIITQWINFIELPSVASVTQPDDILECATSNDTSMGYEYDLRSQNTQILGSLHSSMYTITYHLSQQDADEGVNPLPNVYTNTVDGLTIYARIVHNEVGICHNTTSFKLFIGDYIEPIIATTGTICNEGQLMLTASPGFDGYLWSTGETTRTIFVNEPGLYTVIVEKEYGTEMCDGYTEIDIKESETPEIRYIDVKDWTENDNSITVEAQGAGVYEYSIDGINYQDSNVFNNLTTGIYQVYVKDKYGCGEDVEEVVIMNYPRYFTPNGDGVHDKWYIKYAVLEPDFNVEIFDRYGKFITAFGSTSDGWDGTADGVQLPSTDYWFVVTRQDGRILRGHFAMLR